MRRLKDLIASHKAGARSTVPTMTIAEFAEVWITEVDRGLASLATRGLSRDTVRLAKTMLGKLHKETIREELVANNPLREARMSASVTGDLTSFATAQRRGCSPTTCISR